MGENGPNPSVFILYADCDYSRSWIRWNIQWLCHHHGHHNSSSQTTYVPRHLWSDFRSCFCRWSPSRRRLHNKSIMEMVFLYQSSYRRRRLRYYSAHPPNSPKQEQRLEKGTNHEARPVWNSRLPPWYHLFTSRSTVGWNNVCLGKCAHHRAFHSVGYPIGYIHLFPVPKW